MSAPSIDLPCGARVVVLRLSAMGDVVQATGAVRGLLEARPDLEVAWVVQRAFAPLLEDLGGVTVLAHDRGAGARGYLRTGRRLRDLRPAIALDLQGNWKSAGLARLSGAPLRIGASGAARRERASACLLTCPVALDAATAHPARQAIALVRVLAPSARDIDPWLAARPDEVEREQAAVAALGVEPRRPFRVVVLGDAADPRSIRAPAVAREVEQSALPCLLVAGPAEAAVERPAAVPVLRHARGEVRRLIALGALVARAGGEVVGPDRGATHVLAAAGAPTVCLFGPTDPRRTAPPAARARTTATPPECQPCASRACRRPGGPVCMDVTSADAVASAD